MKLSQFMSQCLALISTPETWTQHEIARGPTSRPCEAMDLNATKFCSVGAILRTGGINTIVLATGVTYEAFKLLGTVMGIPVPSYNDTRTYEQVIGKWVKAIDLAIALESATAELIVMNIPVQAITVVLDDFSYCEEMAKAAMAYSSVNSSVWAENKVQNLISACSTQKKEMLELEATG